MHYGYEIIKYCVLSIQVYNLKFVSSLFELAVCTSYIIGNFFPFVCTVPYVILFFSNE